MAVIQAMQHNTKPKGDKREKGDVSPPDSTYLLGQAVQLRVITCDSAKQQLALVEQISLGLC